MYQAKRSKEGVGVGFKPSVSSIEGLWRSRDHSYQLCRLSFTLGIQPVCSKVRDIGKSFIWLTSLGRYLIMLHSQEWRPDMDVKQLCSAILTKVLDDEKQYQLGLTKIFFRPGVLALLESLRSAKQHELVSTIQKYIRRFLALKHYNSYRTNAVTIQTWWRGVLAQRLYTKKKHEKMALLLQMVSRRWLAMRTTAQVRESIIRTQSRKYFNP